MLDRKCWLDRIQLNLAIINRTVKHKYRLNLLSQILVPINSSRWQKNKRLSLKQSVGRWNNTYWDLPCWITNTKTWREFEWGGLFVPRSRTAYSFFVILLGDMSTTLQHESLFVLYCFLLWCFFNSTVDKIFRVTDSFILNKHKHYICLRLYDPMHPCQVKVNLFISKLLFSKKNLTSYFVTTPYQQKVHL